MDYFNNQFPVLVPVSSVHACPHCWPSFNMRLPDLQDFLCQPYPESTRISLFYQNSLGCWQFQNFRGEIYYRSGGPLHTWYYQQPGLNSQVLCDNASNILEHTYGLFLQSCVSSAYTWLTRGYVKYYRPDHVSIVTFSLEEYNKQATVLSPEDDVYQIVTEDLMMNKVAEKKLASSTFHQVES